MNKIILIGRLVRDPELKYTSSNTPVAVFTLAVNRNFKNADGEYEADFINIQVWRKQAENVSKYCAKGNQIAIEGRLQARSYEQSDGTKKYVTEVIADNVTFLESKKEKENTTPEPTQSKVQEDDDPFKDFGEQIELTDDDLPF